MDFTSSESEPVEQVVVGKITTAFGIEGWVKIYSFTDNPEDIFSYKPWTIKTAQGWKEIVVKKWKAHSNSFVAFLPGCDDRDKALSLAQTEINISKDQFKPLQDDNFYWKDLEGCRVLNQQQQDLGIVQSLMETGANDVMVLKIDRQATPLKSDKGQDLKERLVPYVDNEVILNVDIANKQIIVEWPSDF